LQKLFSSLFIDLLLLLLFLLFLLLLLLVLLLVVLLVLLFGMVVDFVQTASGIRVLKSHFFTYLVSDFSVSLKPVCLDQAT